MMDIENAKTIAEVGLQIVGILSVVAAGTPVGATSKVLMTLFKIIHMGACNFGRAKNAEQT